MKTKLKCNNQVEKACRYMSANNPTGTSFQKCGNLAISKSEFGGLFCKKCEKEYPFQTTPLEN